MQSTYFRMGRLRRGAQRGFTLVELAIVLVIAGIILVAVLKGTDSINKGKVERMVSDLRGLQSTVLEFQKRNGRLPGDCNNDGRIGYVAIPIQNKLLGVSATASELPDFTEGNRDLQTAPTSAQTDVCGKATITNGENYVDLVWNELRRAGVVDQNRLPRELARHIFDDVYQVASIRDTDDNFSGVIVAYGVPVWMAEAIDAAIDGTATNYGTTGATGPANTGRVRLWKGNGGTNTNMTAGTGTTLATYSGSIGQFNGTNENRDTSVSISYQFTTNKLPK